MSLLNLFAADVDLKGRTIGGPIDQGENQTTKEKTSTSRRGPNYQ